jgi:outer membrane protein assembly factor BamB
MENRLRTLTRRGALQFAVGLSALPARGQTGRRFEEVRRIPAAEANQGVAADEQHLYAIDNHAIGKYDKQTGKRVAHWECERGKPLIHLDSGVVYDGVLWCAHSNYPGVPMTSSIETWDAKTLEHSSSYSFGIANGAANWFDFFAGFRYVTFAHFRGNADEADRDPRWTTLVQYDSDWRQRQAWVYPAEVVAKLGNFSISGGVFGRDGRLYATGHDNAEVYVFSFPKGGSTLVLEETIPMPMHGQGIALDPSNPTLLYGIDRRKKEIIVAASLSQP